MPDSRDAKLEALTQTANDLVEEINTLNEGTGRRVEGLQVKLRRNQKILWVVVGSFLADVILTVVLAMTINSVSNITDRLNYTQSVQRARVLCPLYKIFVDSKSDQGRANYPKGPAEYDRLFGVIEESYRVLNCEHVDQPINQ